jgi:sugar lactone lactonase YvrE
MHRLTWALGFALSLTPVSAGAQEFLYGCGGNGSDSPGALFLVNQVTGAQTLIGDPVSPGGLSGLVFDASGNLWGSTIHGNGTTSTLVRIDAQTGALLDTVGAITVPGEGPISIGDLALEPGTGLLWGVRSFADQQAQGGEVYTIDPETAVATFRGDTPGSDGLALGFAVNGALFQSSAALPDTNIERVSTTTLAVLETKTFPTFFDGLAVRPSDGAIYATGDGTMFRVDFAAGAQTELLPGPESGSMSDLAFIPEPACLFADLSALAALGLVSRSRGGRLARERCRARVMTSSRSREPATRTEPSRRRS